MSTFDWYGNRVVSQPAKIEYAPAYLPVHKVVAFAWMRLGLGLIGENVSD